MMSLKLIAFLSFALAVISYAYGQIAAGANTYLPPTKNGYNYPSPTVPFPTRPTPGRPGPGPARPGPGPARPGPGPARPGPGPARPGPGPARPGPQNPPPGAPGHVHEPGMPFDFQYDVKDAETANDYSHKANSDGDVTTGEYRVALPDGRTQVVRYTADWKTGYHADVSYEGEAQFPQGPAGGGPGAGGRGPAGGYKY